MELGLWTWADTRKEDHCLSLCDFWGRLASIKMLTSSQVCGTNWVLHSCLGKMPWAWVENQMDPEPISSLPSALQLSALHWDQLDLEDLRNWHLWVKRDWGKCGFQDSGWTSEPLLLAFLGTHETRPQEWQTRGTLTPLPGHVLSSGLLGPLLTIGLEPHLSPYIIICLFVSTMVSLNCFQHLRMVGAVVF